ncbi:MAG TPA: EAL domain-containing protein [Rhodocyclaceae bacterium]|nr:EAL domain-containing protein [Rhodocyclaceae bacterium]
MAESAAGIPATELTPEQLSLFPLPVVVFDPETLEILEFNEPAERCYGYSRQEMKGLTVAAFYDPEDLPTATAFIARVRHEKWARAEWQHRRKGGQKFPVQTFSTLVNWDGRQARFVAIEDTSERKAREAEAAERDAQFRATMGAAQVGVFVLQDFKFKYVNPVLCQWFGYRDEDLVDRMGPLDLIIPEERDFVLDQMRRRAAGEKGRPYTITCLRKDGSTFPGTILGAPSTFGGKPASVGTLVDLTDLKSAEEQIRRLAYYDVLTGLPNRALLKDRAELALARADREASSVALLFVDLDRFKNVNDSLGHSFGDRLLAAVAERLIAGVRRSDTISRLGGDEFVMLVSDAEPLGIAELAAKLLDRLAAPFTIGDHELTVTASVGIALYPQDGRDVENLLKNADTAMYQAKQKGRNGYRFFTAAMNAAAMERLKLEGRLRQAIERQEFELHYQPLVRIADGEIVGAEALVRWRAAEGLVPPDRFIPAAEDSGLIVAIGDWVLREACRQNRAWRDAGLPAIRISVNISAVQFHREGFLRRVAAIVAGAGLTGGDMELEITEGVAMSDADVTAAAMDELKAMGLAIAIDDFGTGYSSLAYLRRYPIDRLKIDRSFVRDMVEDADDRAIAGTVAALAKALRLSVVAEGVESQKQLRLLRDQGCDVAQGYLFSRPVPAAEFARLLASRVLVPAA